MTIEKKQDNDKRIIYGESMKYLIILMVLCTFTMVMYGNTYYNIPFDTTSTDTSYSYFRPPPDAPLPCRAPMACEECIQNGTPVPWGQYEVYIVPYPMCEDNNQNDTCKARVIIRKRVCNGRYQLKIIAARLVSGCRCPCLTDQTLTQAFLSPSVALWWLHAVGWASDKNYYNWEAVTSNQWEDIDMYSYSCNGFYKDNSICEEYIIPCKEYACCILTNRIKNDCSMNVINGEWNDKFNLERSGCKDCSAATKGIPKRIYVTEMDEYDVIRIGLDLQREEQIDHLKNATDPQGLPNNCKWSCPSDGMSGVDDDYQWNYDWSRRKDKYTKSKRRKGSRKR